MTILHKIKKTKVENEYLRRNKKLRNSGFKNYSRFLKSSIWEQIKERASKYECINKCTFCKKESKTILHHIKYKNVTKVSLNNIVPCCFECHTLIHKIQQYYKINSYKASRRHAINCGWSGSESKMLNRTTFFKNLWK